MRRPGFGAIVLSGVVVLGLSAAAAWFLQTGVGRATAQSGQKVAATGPSMTYASTEISASRQDEALAVPPRIARITIDNGRPSVVEGTAPARSTVSLYSGAQLIGTTSARPDGSWRLVVDHGLGLDDHRLLVRAVPFGGTVSLQGDQVRVSAPRGFQGPLVVTLAAESAANATPTAMQQAISEATVTTDQRSAPPSIRLAQAAPVGRLASGDGAVGAMRDWLQRADRNYQDVVIKKLSAPVELQQGGSRVQPAQVVAQAQPASPPTKAPTAAPGDGSVFDGVFDWLKRSSETYQKAIVKRLTEPQPTLESLEAGTKADDAKKAADAKVGEDAQQKAREELRAAQVKRDADLKAAEAAPKPVTDPAAKAAAPPVAPKAEDDAALRKAAEDKRIADETMKRQADLKAAEDKRAADAKKVADEDAAKEALVRKAADDKQQADAAAQRSNQQKAADAAKKSTDEAAARDVAAKKLADDKRLADEAARIAAERKATDAAKAADERRLAQEAATRAASEAKKAADMARESEIKQRADLKAAEDARQVAAKTAAATAAQEAAARRIAEQKADIETRRRAAELAEAASKEASTRIAAPSRSRSEAEPPLPSVSTGRARSAPRVAAASPPRSAALQARRRAALDISSRSALGAGRAAAAAGRRAFATTDDGCRNAGRRIKPPGYYVVKAGDSLWDIADLHYNDGARFETIERANRRIDDPDLIKPCQRIFIPAAKRG